MTYSSGGVIQATDFNVLQTALNTVWNNAYGQTAITPVSAGLPVSASAWSILNTTVSKLAAHEGTTITSRTNPVVGQVITPLPNLASDITACITNELNAATQGTQYTGWTGTSSKTTATGSGASSWTITYTHTITFASTTAASYFFNAGGTVKIQQSKTSTGTSSDPEWNNFVNNVTGTIVLSSDGASKTINGQTLTGTTKIGGSGSPAILATGIGFNQLTSTPTIIYKQFDAGAAYSSNYIQVSASVSGATITLTTVWTDTGDIYGADISGGTATTGITFGSAPTVVVTYLPPETTYLINTWGTPTVTAAVI